jgi:hypothetical protein
MFTDMREQEMEFLDDDYRQQEFESRERRVSSKTLELTELFNSFGEIFSASFKKEKENEIKNI